MSRINPIARRFFSANAAASRWVESFFPKRLRTDGNGVFLRKYTRFPAAPGSVVYDIGGGSQPFINLGDKQWRNLILIGLDISADELEKAPTGVYDRTIAADICDYQGEGDADVVVCQALLEHVPDGAAAIRAIATTLKPGGKALIFAPCRNAIFARLNLALPEGFKRWLLRTLHSSKGHGHDGFPSYYDCCTPRDVERLAEANGLTVEDRQFFWVSSYFKALLPAYLLWRLAQGIAYLLFRENAAETYIYVLRKNGH